ncbi:hypothetical protein P886_3342 [Alteromonadaceae bacterium 2753L.S.0a.02]|nr:hypothetical protein P886_3342 [Alteromonadaceae bacterium 2753L.S.0a.02]
MTRAITKQKNKSSSYRTFRQAPLPFFIGLVLAGNAIAGPEGEQVVGGVGSVSRTGKETVINQATDRLAINWRNFDVNSDERVQFIQPSNSSVALNNILSNTASHINGRIDANGQLIFVNPHGLIFGQNSVINAGGILASGLSIDANDFINGNLTFSALENTDGLVINAGLLNAATGGSVSLLGKRVQNDGLISANLGSVTFAAGREAVVTFDNEGQVGIRITDALLQEDIGVDPAVVNAGEIQAEGGKVLLTASTSQDIFSQAVNSGGLDYNRSVVVNDDGSFTIGEGADVLNSGVVNVSGETAGAVVVLGENVVHSGEILADSVSGDTGGYVEIHSRDTTLLTESSLVDANAEQGKGGDIKLLGERVGLLDDTRVSANGGAEGGQVLVGGDYRGGNSLVRNASGVYFDVASQIKTDALGGQGEGGRIILWGNDSLKAYGELSARGFVEGGFIETSAGVVDLNLDVNVSSVSGWSGTWLIDPYNITIEDSSTTNVTETPDYVIDAVTYDSRFTAPSSNNSILDIDDLQSALSNGANVIVETSGAGVTEDGDIIQNVELDYNGRGHASLTYRAHDDIFINYNIKDTNADFGNDSLNLTLQADYDANGAGGVNVATGVSVETQGGNFTASGASFSSEGTINVSSVSGGGDIVINVANGASIGQVTIGDSSDTLHASNSSVFNVTATNISLSNNLVYGVGGSTAQDHTVNLNFNASGNITFSNVYADNSTGNDILNIDLIAGTDSGTILITSTSTNTLWLTGGNFTANGHDFTITGTGGGSAGIGTEGGAFSVGGVTPITGTFDSSGGVFHTTLNSNQAGNITIRANEDIQLGVMQRDGWSSTSTENFDLYISAGDDLTIEQSLDLDRLSGSGSAINTFTFLAGNLNPTDAFDADNTNVDGIHIKAAVTATNDVAQLIFGSPGGDANLSNFKNTQTIDSNGGDITISVDGDIALDTQISTGGGNFVIGDTSNSVYANNVSNSVQFNTEGGNFEIYASGDVEVGADILTNGGAFIVGGASNASRPALFNNYGDVSGDGSDGGLIDTSGGAITINTVVDGTANGDIFLGEIDNSYDTSTGLSGDISITSGNDIVLMHAYDFDKTGNSAPSGQDDNPTFITLTLSADNNITLSELISDTNNGDRDTLNLQLNAGLQSGSAGVVNVDNHIYTGGGNLTVSGVNFDSEGFWLHTGLSNSSGGGTTTTGGDINLNMSGTIALGSLRTEGGFGGGELNLTSNGNITQASGATIEVNGTTSINSGVSGDVTFDNTGNQFDKAVTIINAQDVWINNESVEIGSVYFTNARDLTLVDNEAIVIGGTGTSPTITGDFSVTSTGITGDGAFTVVGAANFSSAGGEIILNDNSDYQDVVTVADATRLQLRDTAGDLLLGAITINGSGLSNNITATSGSITQSSGNFTISGNSSATGSLTLSGNAIDINNITSTGASDQNGGSITLTASAGDISTGSLTSNGGSASGGESGNNAGAITVNASGAISLGAVQAKGSDGNDNSNNGTAQYDGGNGANISITSSGSGTITLAGVSSDGGDGNAQDTNDADDASGGDAGIISVATAGDVFVAGDITARGGHLWDASADTNISNGQARSITITGDLFLTASTLIDATVNNTPSGYPAGHYEGPSIPGTVTINGSIDGTTATTENLTVRGGAITLTGNLGETVSLGDVIIESNDYLTPASLLVTGDVDADGFSITSKSFEVTANSFISDAINTAGSSGNAGGDITINVAASASTGDLSTAGGSGSNGYTGGAIAIAAQSINIGSVNSTGGAGDLATGAGGTAGTVALAASDNGGAPSVIVNGDINTEGGAGATAGAATTAVLSLSGSGTTTGSVTLNHSAFLTSSITVNGNSQSGATDTLNGLAVDSFWVSTANGAGRIDNAASSPTTSITFNNIEVLQGGSAVDEFTLAHNFKSVSGGGNADIFTVSAAITSRLLGEGGDDVFHLNGGVNDGLGATQWDVDGGTGKDTFNVAAAISTTTIDGSGGDEDTITLIDENGSFAWVLTSASAGSLNNISFTNIEQINGADTATGSDSFEFLFQGNYGGASGGIDGRGGDDSLKVTIADIYEIALGDSFRGMENVEAFEGGGAGFTLQLSSNSGLANTTTHWDIDGTNSGTITNDNGTPGDNTDDVSLTFLNFAALQGNEANDNFEVSTGSIENVSGVRSDGVLGALESNALTLSSGTNTWLLNGANQGSASGSHTTSFSNIQNLNGAGSDTLTARNQNNTWTLDTDYTLAATGSSPSDTVTFSGMAILNGNNQADNFVINASVAMMLNGGAGDDTFDLSSGGTLAGGGEIIGGSEGVSGDRLIARTTANTWSLDDTTSNSVAVTSGSTYVDSFSGIEILEGSDSAADLFDFATFTAYQIVAGSSSGDISDYADVAGAISVTVGSATISGIDRFVGNQDGIGSAGTNNSTLTYSSTSGSSVAWDIFDFDLGDVDADGINDGSVAGIEFINFNNLTGGDGNDSFTIDQSTGVAGLSGILSGGANSGTLGDQVFAPDVDITWNVAPQTGNASLAYDNGRAANPTRSTTSFIGIETLNSGAGNDDFSVGQATTITLNAGDGLDTITLPDEDLSITLGDAVGGLALNGFETLTAFINRNNQLTVNSTSSEIVLWDIDDPNSGSVKVGSADAVNFNNFQVLVGGDGDDTFNFSDDGSVVRAGAANGAVDGAGGVNVLTGRAENTTWTINAAGAGYLTATASSAVYVEQFSNIETLQGQSTTDVFTVTNSGSFSGTIEGSGGGDTLAVASVTGERNEWRLLDSTTLDRVQRLNASSSASSSIEFSGITNLTGGSGVDDFIFLGEGPYGGTVNAGNGGSNIDSVDLSNLTVALNVSLSSTGVYGVQNVERVVGNGANSTLNGLTTGTNNWRISSTDGTGNAINNANGQNDGVLSNGSTSVQFVDFATLNGGASAIDNFTLTTSGSVSGNMVGGTATAGTVVDTVTTESNNRTFTLSASGAGNVNGNDFIGIENLSATGTGDTVVGINQDNNWRITGIDAGRVSEVSDANTFSFTGMENLSGNQGNDAFVLVDNTTGDDGQVTGTIRGTAQTLTDSGTDTLTLESGSGQVLTWVLSVNGGETRASVTNRIGEARSFEELIGGDGTDIFELGNALVSIALDGGNSSNDLIRITHGSATEWFLSNAGGTPDSVSVSGQGSVEFQNIEIAEGSNSAADIFNVYGDASSLSELKGRGGDDRLVLDTTATGDINLLFVAGSGIDELRAGARDNTWRVSGSGNTANTLNYVSASARGVVFDASLETLTGGTGNDDFYIGTTGALNVTVAGGDGAGSDTLYGANRANTWVIGGASFTANTLNAQDAANLGVVFSGIENYVGESNQDLFSLLSGSVGGEIVGGGGTSDSLTINRNTGGTTNWLISDANEGTVDGIANGFREIENLAGGDGVDAFAISASGSLSGMLAGAGGLDTLNLEAFVDGVAVEITDTVNTANDKAGLVNLHVNTIETLTAAADADVSDATDTEANNWLTNSLSGNFNWTISDTNDGQIASTTGAISPINFVNFGNLEAGTGDDSFAFTGSGAITGNFDGGTTGSDTADFSQLNGDIVIALNDPDAAIQFSEIERLVGNNDGSDAGNSNTTTLSVATGTTTWNVTGLNSGRVDTVGVDIDFVDFNILEGGSGLDTFNLSTAASWISGAIIGGDGTVTATDPADIVNAQNLSSNFVAQVDGTSFGNLNIFGIETIQANGTGKTLQAANTGSHDWEITQTNGGLLNGVLSFEGFDTLVGNGEADNFSLSEGVSMASVQGGGGMDRLSVASAAETNVNSSNYTTWTISGTNSGDVSGRVNAFTSIEHLTGGEGQDAFVFSSASASLTGLINGGESSQATDVNIDTLDVSIFNDGVIDGTADGVVVELGDELALGTIVEDTGTLANVNAYNIESITASTGNENSNWLALNHDRNVVLRMTAVNDGYIQDGDDIASLVPNTRVDFYNFGSLQGGGGDMDDNIVEGNPTGEVREGTGRRSRNFSGVDGLVVVDISPNLVSVTGNNNTLLRVAASDSLNPDGDFNGENTWQISGQNEGTFNADYLTYVLEFSNVNMLQGGTGNDNFNFVYDSAAGTNGSLVDGFVNGSGGSNTITVSTTSDVLTFGVNSVQTTPTVPDFSYPDVLTQPVYLMNNRADVIDIANVLSVTDNNAGAATTRLMSSDAGTAVWTLDSVNGYRLVDNSTSLSFSGVDGVVGGAANDTFNVVQLGSMSEIIDGGDGLDILNISSLSGPQHLSLDASDQGTADFILANLETLQASFDDTGHRLSADNLDNTWNITSANGGSISYDNGAGGTQTLNFNNVAHLEGGDAQDIFQISQSGNLTGTINGGSEGATPDQVQVLSTSTQTFVFQQTTLDSQNHAVNIADDQIDVFGIEQLHANNTASHTLLGADSANNTWDITATQNTLSNANGSLVFSGIANLTGGSQQDIFTFDGNTVTGLVDGGANDNATIDTVTLRNMASVGVSAVHLGAQVNIGEVNLANVEQVTSQTTADNLTLIGDNTSNTWTIQGSNAGTVNAVSFSGFANLQGGTGNDTFILARQTNASEDDRITGLIDGGVNPTTGNATDRVDLLGVQDAVTVSLDPSYSAYLVLANIEQLDASANNNTLVGGNNTTQTWTISGQDEGTLGSLSFGGFANLLGRDQIDIFNFTQNGTVSGLVDGGSQPVNARDRVDMSELSVANVVIGDTNSGFENIEEYYGNNSSSTITAANVRNVWSITGENSGEIQDQNGNDIAFAGFTTLVGGNVVDEFTLNGGSISGEIRAGSGQDRLNVDLGNGLNGGVTFIGGGDGDTVFIDGGDVNNRFAASYTPASASDNETFSYNIEQAEQTFSYDIELADTETVNNRVYTSVLTVNDIENSGDTMILANNRVEYEGVRTINIANNEGYNVVAEQNDTVLIDGNLMLDNTFSVTNASLAGTDLNAMITATGIRLNSTGEIGSSNARFAIDADTLSLTGVRGDVFLSQDGNLTLAALSNPGGTIDIEATGNIASSGNFTSSNAVRLLSDGNITLNNNHALAGELTLLAADGDVHLTNGTTVLGDVRAQNFALNTTGSVDDQGSVQVVNQTTITGASTSIVTLDNEDNQFELLDIVNAGTLILHDSSDNGVVVSGSVANAFSITSPNGITSNAITADDVSLLSANNSVLIQNAITAGNSVVVQAEGVDVNSAVNVTASTAEQAIQMDSGSASLNIRGALLANENLAGNIALQGNAITQFLGANIAGADILMNSASGITLGADVAASQDLSATAASTIVMDGGSNFAHAQAQNLTFNAGSGIVAEQLSATNMSLTAQNGDIVQQAEWNADDITITANSGTFENRANTRTTFGSGGFEVNASRVELSGDIQSANGALLASAANAMVIEGNISTAGLALTAGGQLGMTPGAHINSSMDASLNAGSELQISSIQAAQGTVSLTAGGAITDNNAEANNITADALVARTGTGFGGISDADTIDTSVANMDVLNASGNIGVTNDRDVEVTALISNGDIRMVNTQGNVTMANANEGEYDRTASDARLAGGVINANYDYGNVTLVIQDGYLTATPGPYFRRPELVGDIVDVTTSDGFGVNRQLVVYAQTELIVSGPGIRPIWAFGEAPIRGLTTDSDLIDPSIVGSVSELLIEVEDVEYIDPAVFTNVRNFAFGDMPIRMPRDQLYDDELSDEEDESERF